MIDFNEKKVRYFLDPNKKLHFEYRDYYGVNNGGSIVLELTEMVPDEIQDRKNIDLYAEERVKNYLEERFKKIDEQMKFEQNPDFFIEMEHEKIKLSGRIIRASARGFTVRLEKPFLGERNINYGFASAMAGHHVFSDHCQFSEDAIDTAKSLLLLIYKDIIREMELKKRLNGK